MYIYELHEMYFCCLAIFVLNLLVLEIYFQNKFNKLVILAAILQIWQSPYRAGVRRGVRPFRGDG